MEADRSRDEAEPYFAYCKGHVDKLTAKATVSILICCQSDSLQRRRFLRLQEAFKYQAQPLGEDEVGGCLVHHQSQ